MLSCDTGSFINSIRIPSKGDNKYYFKHIGSLKIFKDQHRHWFQQTCVQFLPLPLSGCQPLNKRNIDAAIKQYKHLYLFFSALMTIATTNTHMHTQIPTCGGWGMRESIAHHFEENAIAGLPSDTKWSPGWQQEAEETTFSGIVKWLFEQREANRGLLLLLACEYSWAGRKMGWLLSFCPLSLCHWP